MMTKAVTGIGNISEFLGQPITIAVVLTHKKPGAPRLDVVSDRSKVPPDDKLPRRDKIGANAGYIYADDAEFARRVAGNTALMKRLKDVRNEYIRLDRDAVSFFFAGTETEYSGMIRLHPVTASTPTVFVCVGGWFLLVGVPLILCFVMQPSGQA